MKLLRNLTLALLGISIQLAPLHSGAMELTKQDNDTFNNFMKDYKGQKRNVLYTTYKKPFCGSFAMAIHLKDVMLDMKDESDLAKNLRDQLRTITKSNSSKLFNQMTQETYNSHMNRLYQLNFANVGYAPIFTIQNKKRLDKEDIKSFDDVQDALSIQFNDPKTNPNETAFLAAIFDTTKKQALELTTKLNLDLSDRKSIDDVNKFLNGDKEICDIYTNVEIRNIYPAKINIYAAIYFQLLLRNSSYLIGAGTKVTYDRDFQFGEFTPDEMDSKIRNFFNYVMTENDKSLENRIGMKHFYLMAKYGEDVTEEFMGHDYETYTYDRISNWLINYNKE